MGWVGRTVDCCCCNYNWELDPGMDGWKKGVLIGGALFTALAAGLYVKNLISEGQMNELTKEQIIHILKKVRKEKYLMFKQIATLAQNLAQQMRNNINVAMIEQFVKGPESPVQPDQEHERVLKQVC